MTTMPLEMDARTLWSDVGRTRYFLIPDGHEPPRGPFVVWTFTGRRLDADEGALAPFEITAEQAKAWATEEFGRVLDAGRGAVEDFVARIRRATAALRAEGQSVDRTS